MKTQTSFKRLVLRAVLGNVSPIVIGVLAVPDYLDLASFDEIFRALLGWEGLGFGFHAVSGNFSPHLRRAGPLGMGVPGCRLGSNERR